MASDILTFETVLTAFQDYLIQDDCVEVVQTSRGYAVIEWDERLENWVEIVHCPTPPILQRTLLNARAGFYGIQLQPLQQKIVSCRARKHIHETGSCTQEEHATAIGQCSKRESGKFQND